jgi:hypothetical protein
MGEEVVQCNFRVQRGANKKLMRKKNDEKEKERKRKKGKNV